MLYLGRMEKLFQRGNIGLQPFVDEEGLDEHFAYTEQLLALNVLIEIYTAVLDDSEEGYEEETVIFATTYDQERSYSFALFHSTEVVGPLVLYGIISDAISYIEQSNKETLLDDLEEISTGQTTSELADTPQLRKKIYESDVWKFKSVIELIKENRR